MDIQPVLSPLESCAYMKMFFAPVNVGWKVKARFNVSVVPEPDIEEPEPFTVHLLFCKAPDPGLMGPSHADALSFAR